MTIKDHHIIKDPVHGAMNFSETETRWINPFIDSVNFQRLRQIKQGGLGDWFFIGAVHTRFNHSIGTCYVAKQIAEQLELSAEDRQIVMLAALMHDIGHGPFSHVFEGIFHRGILKHENWAPFFLDAYLQPKFLEAFNRSNPDHPLTPEKMHLIQRLIVHQEKERQLLADIISSQLDADRLDYLLRDSLFCGVEYGKYDLPWMLHCMTDIAKDGKRRLGMTYKGLGAVEHYLMARRLMIYNVYHHGKKYATEFLLQQFLRQVSKGLADDPQFASLWATPLVQFLKQTIAFNRAAKTSSDLPTLCQKFMTESYSLYQELCDYDVLALIRYLAVWDYDHPAVTLAKRLYYRGLPKTLRISDARVDQAKKIIEDYRKNHPEVLVWQLALLSLPHLAYKVNEDSILMEDAAGVVHYLHDFSMMINLISDQQESAYIVSIDIELLEKLKAQGIMDQLYNL